MAEAVQRVNHYAEKPVVLADAGLAKLRVSGVFNAGDAQAFAEAVMALLPVSARSRADGAIVIAAGVPPLPAAQ